ncbi:MAG TPA: Calx-beta domain-containing protein [Luteimonas sp.]|nr:Calx-beta domain-containing protein [Luteimonas sp.]
MKRWKAAGAGLAALGLLVLVARIGVGAGSTDPSLDGQASTAVTDRTATGSDGRSPNPAASRRTTLALPAIQGDRPSPLRLTRNTLEQAWQRGRLDIALPGGQRYSVELEEQRFDPGGQWTVVGHAQTRLGPQAMVLTFGPDAVFGVLPNRDGSLMQVTTTRGNVEVAAAGGMLPRGRKSRLGATPDYAIPAAAGGGKAASPPSAAPLTAATAQATASATTEIVVLGVYTDDLVALRGSVSAAETEVTNLFAITNQAHVDSATGVHFKVAALKRVAIDPALDNQSILYAVTDNTIAGVDLAKLRDDKAADLVAVVRPNHETDWTCGVGWMNGAGRTPQGVWDHYGVSVSNVSPCGPYVLAHEMGHNLGSAHDRETMTSNGHLDYGVYEYSFGYRQAGPPAFATIMAYPEGGQPWLGYFSSPGSSSCGAACGLQDQADNARSLRNMAPVIAGFRGPPGTLSIVDAEAYESEADGPTAFLSFRVRLSGIAPAGGVAFDAVVSNGTAKAGTDYTPLTQTRYLIPEGEREVGVYVDLIGDAVKETDETIKVTLANVTGATVYDGEAVGRIVNDDPRLKVSGHARFDGAPVPTSSFLMNVNGLASGSDSITLELVPPDFAYEIRVPKGASPTLYVDAPAPFAMLPVTLGEVLASRVRDLKMKKGVNVSGKVRVPAGQPALTEPMWLAFGANINGVSQPIQPFYLEPPDFKYSQWVVPGAWVYMEITPPSPYQRVVANRPVTNAGYVQDLPLSTLPGLIVWNTGRDFEGPPGSHGMTSGIIDLSAPAPAGGVTLSYRTVDGTAKAGSDYEAVSGTLKIPEGETSAYTDAIILNGDNQREGDETFYVVVSNVVGANPVVTRVEFIMDEQAPHMSGPLPPLRK